MAQLIDGKAISAQIKEEVKEKVTALKEQGCEVVSRSLTIPILMASG